MIKLRKSIERGKTKIEWLESYHTFSFTDYHDPDHMGFRALRVINDDRVAPGGGFGKHPHHDMEIITYVLEGSLAHQDSMGNGSVITPGEVQLMSAGSGVTHSEYNHSQTEPVHFLQIWIVPKAQGFKPTYQQAKFSESQRKNRLCLVASQDGREGSLTIRQDVDLFFSLLNSGQSLKYTLRSKRFAWVQSTKGTLEINGVVLKSGDGAALSDEKNLEIVASKSAEILLFDLG